MFGKYCTCLFWANNLKNIWQVFCSVAAAEQNAFYDGSAVEYADRHKFTQHLRAWGSAHHGPGIRLVCTSDALDDPDHKGFWTTLPLWNKWRHETYKERRDDELIYLDELATAPAAAPVAVEEKLKPDVLLHFTLFQETTHTYGGSGKMVGQTCLAGGFIYATSQVAIAVRRVIQFLRTCLAQASYSRTWTVANLSWPSNSARNVRMLGATSMTTGSSTRSTLSTICCRTTHDLFSAASVGSITSTRHDRTTVCSSGFAASMTKQGCRRT